MMPFSVGRFPRGLLLICVFVAALSFAEDGSEASVPINSLVPSSTKLPTQVPSVSICCDGSIAYLGSYSPDGKYRPLSRFARWHNQQVEDDVVIQGTRPKEVPRSTDLHARERVLENLEPPLHAKKPVKGHSGLVRLRDDIITAVYGRELALLAPRDVTTDSRGRVITVDPTAAAVHVLDDEHSFRLLAGPHRRLLQPNDVAVDAEDNIYVSDSGRGFIVVYDADGRFLRYIGKLDDDESLFHYPTGIAIDRQHERLYVLDSMRHEMFILGLQGNIIKRVGRSGGDSTAADFEFPTEIAIRDRTIAVLDSAGSRIVLLDLDGNPTGAFGLAPPTRRGIVTEMGLALDGSGRIFVSNIPLGNGSSEMRIYDRTGKQTLAFGKPGTGIDSFQAPGGLWIDSADHMYVSDTLNRRVQVFQLKTLAVSNSPK
jgi:DNA-binding beta-propeller fold protein YncE